MGNVNGEAVNTHKRFFNVPKNQSYMGVNVSGKLSKKMFKRYGSQASGFNFNVCRKKVGETIRCLIKYWRDLLSITKVPDRRNYD